MFNTDLSTNPSTALTVGTNSAKTFSLQSMPNSESGKSLRSDPTAATTAPKTLQIGHSTRVIKGPRYASTKVDAPVIVDSHLIRLDEVVGTPTLNLLDPSFQIALSSRLILEVPRLGADTPTAATVMDQILRIMVVLNPSANAGLIKLLNREF